MKQHGRVEQCTRVDNTSAAASNDVLPRFSLKIYPTPWILFLSTDYFSVITRFLFAIYTGALSFILLKRVPNYIKKAKLGMRIWNIIITAILL